MTDGERLQKALEAAVAAFEMREDINNGVAQSSVETLHETHPDLRQDSRRRVACKVRRDCDDAQTVPPF